MHSQRTDHAAQQSRYKRSDLACQAAGYRSAPIIQSPVEIGGAGDLFSAGLDSYRLVADHSAALTNRRDEGVHPVMIAVLAPVLDHPHPDIAALEVVPHVRKQRCRNTRMTAPAMGLATQLPPGLARTLYKGR